MSAPRPRETRDPTAGERARAIREHPEDAQVILDPTDPRYGEPMPGETDKDRRLVEEDEPEDPTAA